MWYIRGKKQQTTTTTKTLTKYSLSPLRWYDLTHNNNNNNNRKILKRIFFFTSFTAGRFLHGHQTQSSSLKKVKKKLVLFSFFPQPQKERKKMNKKKKRGATCFTWNVEAPTEGETRETGGRKISKAPLYYTALPSLSSLLVEES